MAALYVFRKIDTARLPTKGSPGAAGYDLYSCEDTVVKARSKALIQTGIVIKIEPGHYGRIAPRSGLAVKHSIDVGAGVIDCDYRGDVGVVLFNHSDTDFEIKRGDRIAQLIVELIASPDVVEVDDLDRLGDTKRGNGGFGSTGLNELVINEMTDDEEIPGPPALLKRQSALCNLGASAFHYSNCLGD